MEQYKNPPQDTWPNLAKRPQFELEFLESSVKNILNRVKSAGDAAIREFSLQFDNVKLDKIEVTKAEFENANSRLNPSVKQAIEIASNNIRKFHSAQKSETLKIETMPGVTCWKKSIPIQRVGLYIPGGTAPLFSTVLMLALPAQIAGCEEIIMCTPPNADGTVNDAILFSASLCGVTRVFKAGGAQAIAAMAYGTSSIPAVYKIFGPGNQFVTKAKQMVSQDGVAIDLPAGPSEVMVIVDESADPSFVAADLLSQAEHGADSQVVLLSLNELKLREIRYQIDLQLPTLPRMEIASGALDNSIAIYFSDKAECIAFANMYAPEHLIINTNNPEEISDAIVNAGSVFLGPYSPEAIGDYASGTNHTLPTNGFAKAHSGVSLDSFTKSMTYQKLTPEGLKALGPSVEIMAEAEQLLAHKAAISVRLRKLP